MSTEQDLMGLGMPPSLAGSLGITPVALTGAGTTQGAATLITTRFPICTASGGATGFVLPASPKLGEPYYIVSVGTTASKIWPGTGGTINGGSANAGVTFSASPAAAIFVCTAVTTTSATWVTIPGTPGN
jgi:hypothetical protein